MNYKMMKTYVLMLSQTFPSSHKRSGEMTDFRRKFRRTNCRRLCPLEDLCKEDCMDTWRKIHTLRANSLLWERRFREIEKGKACLSIRQWEGLPYKSRQVELARLTREDGIGMEVMDFCRDMNGCIEWSLVEINGAFIMTDEVAKNDGLSTEDWKEWFRSYNMNKPLAVIHFTDFRYSKEKERNESGNCNKD